ncbi:hypothetical protein M2298_003810 [Brevibacillus sp. 1238]|jgi:hypothetical protein|nr:hypothetical protein [Brevibacillus sp. 1238]
MRYAPNTIHLGQREIDFRYERSSLPKGVCFFLHEMDLQ